MCLQTCLVWIFNFNKLVKLTTFLHSSSVQLILHLTSYSVFSFQPICNTVL